MRSAPAVSSLPLQVSVYYNIQYAIMYFFIILTAHVNKVCVRVRVRAWVLAPHARWGSV